MYITSFFLILNVSPNVDNLLIACTICKTKYSPNAEGDACSLCSEMIENCRDCFYNTNKKYTGK